jgi:hypothetical protein
MLDADGTKIAGQFNAVNEQSSLDKIALSCCLASFDCTLLRRRP